MTNPAAFFVGLAALVGLGVVGCGSDAERSARDAQEIANELPPPRDGVPDDPPQEGGMPRGGSADVVTPPKPGR
jgi:hypothetical protein